MCDYFLGHGGDIHWLGLETPRLGRVRATDGRTDRRGEKRRYKKQSERKKTSEKGRGIEQRQGQRCTAQ